MVYSVLWWMMNNRKFNALMWILVVIFAVVNFLRGAFEEGVVFKIAPYVFVLLLTVFSVWHGIRRYGAKKMLVFFAITFVVSFSYETLSILTGFPFGNYDYSDSFGLKIWLVPSLIMPAYFSVGYLSWTIGHSIIGKFNLALGKTSVFAVPLVASFIMVMWDMVMDPSKSTIGQKWIWEEGGAYFGVPFSNFLGWFLCVFTIFLLFALYQRSQGSKFPRESEIIADKVNWMQPMLMYVAIPLEFFASAIFFESREVTSLDGHVWWTGDIYFAAVLVSLFTMVPIVVLGIVNLRLLDKRPASQ